MVENSLRQGPLDHLGLAARAEDGGISGLRLAVPPFRWVTELRGDLTPAFQEAVEQALQIALPTSSPEASARQGKTAFWMGPDRWWIVSTEEELDGTALRRALKGFSFGVFEIGESLAIISLEGAYASDLLAKGCTIDLHPSAFKTGQVVQTNLAKAQVTLHRSGDNAFDLYLRRSFAEYLWAWLEDASLEYQE